MVLPTQKNWLTVVNPPPPHLTSNPFGGGIIRNYESESIYGLSVLYVTRIPVEICPRFSSMFSYEYFKNVIPVELWCGVYL